MAGLLSTKTRKTNCDEELLFAIQLSGGKVLHLEISFLPSEPKENSSKLEDEPNFRKERKVVRLNQKQDRMREKLASLSTEENPRAKARASKLEAKIASVATKLESLNLSDKENATANASPVLNSSVELTTPYGGTCTDNIAKHTDRKVKCNKVSCLQRKQYRIRTKLAELSEDDHSGNPRKLAKISKLQAKLAAISSKLEEIEKASAPSSSSPPVMMGELAAPSVPSSGVPSSEIPDSSKQLVQEVKAKFFAMRRDLHQDRMNILSLVKVLKALKVISRHGISAGITLDDQLAQAEVSLGIAQDEFAAKKLVIQQQKELLALMKSQLGRGGKRRYGKRGKTDKKDKKEKFEKGGIAKSDKKKKEKKLRGEKWEKKAKHCRKRGRRATNKHEDDMSDVSSSTSSSTSDD